jgi:tetratricopeptide (TPR) repeat protein
LRRQRAGEALPHLERALRLGGHDDPQTLLALAVAEELLASAPTPLVGLAAQDPALAARLELRRRDAGTGASLELERRALLESSERHLRGALAHDPQLLEAHVRLGRVLALRGRPEAARREWRDVLRVAQPDDPVAYLAHVFLGTQAWQVGEWTEAVAQFRGAIGAFPRAQSARLGLSFALRRSGDRPGAAREARAALGLDAAMNDPWLRYHHEPRRGVAEMLQELCRQ